jgi:lysophospholipase L1-like esterase
MAGTNDLGKLKSHTAIFDDLRSLHAVCHALGVRSVALAPPPAPFALRGHPWEVERQRLVARLAGWAQSERGVAAFIDPGEFLPAFGAGELWETDGLHLSPAGSRQLGRCLAQRLVPLLRRQVPATCRVTVPRLSNPRESPRKSTTVPVGAEQSATSQ